jgi:hypothetical protein
MAQSFPQRLSKKTENVAALGKAWAMGRGGASEAHRLPPAATNQRACSFFKSLFKLRSRRRAVLYTSFFLLLKSFPGT